MSTKSKEKPRVQPQEKTSQAEAEPKADVTASGQDVEEQAVRRDEKTESLLNDMLASALAEPFCIEGRPIFVFYRISDRVCLSMVTDATTFGADGKLTIIYFDAKAAGRSQQVIAQKGKLDGCWWHSPKELEAAIAYDRKLREDGQT